MVFFKYATMLPGKNCLPNGAYNILKAISDITEAPGKFVKIELLSGKSYFGTLERIIGSERNNELPANFLEADFSNNVFENSSSANYHYLMIKMPHDQTNYRIISVRDIKELKIFVPNEQNSSVGTYKTFLEATPQKY